MFLPSAYLQTNGQHLTHGLQLRKMLFCRVQMGPAYSISRWSLTPRSCNYRETLAHWHRWPVQTVNVKQVPCTRPCVMQLRGQQVQPLTRHLKSQSAIRCGRMFTSYLNPDIADFFRLYEYAAMTLGLASSQPANIMWCGQWSNVGNIRVGGGTLRCNDLSSSCGCVHQSAWCSVAKALFPIPGLSALFPGCASIQN
jgi:hypothetical protein